MFSLSIEEWQLLNPAFKVFFFPILVLKNQIKHKLTFCLIYIFRYLLKNTNQNLFVEFFEISYYLKIYITFVTCLLFRLLCWKLFFSSFLLLLFFKLFMLILFESFGIFLLHLHCCSKKSRTHGYEYYVFWTINRSSALCEIPKTKLTRMTNTETKNSK